MVGTLVLLMLVVKRGHRLHHHHPHRERMTCEPPWGVKTFPYYALCSVTKRLVAGQEFCVVS